VPLRWLRAGVVCQFLYNDKKFASVFVRFYIAPLQRFVKVGWPFSCSLGKRTAIHTGILVRSSKVGFCLVG
jgi:hypothetical protein